jgi:hypothetical protein
MRQAAAIAVGAWLVWPAGLSAHRLDEYLQATQISLSAGAVEVTIDLTPGVEVAERVIALVDRDGDEVLSPDERARYADLVIGATALEIDGRREPITLVDHRFPPVDALRAGTGTIHLAARAARRSRSGGPHELRYFNLHEPEVSAYLVNVLMPPEGIAITAQRRDPWQRELTLAFTTPASSGGFRRNVLLVGGLLLSSLAAWRLGRRPRGAPGPAGARG